MTSQELHDKMVAVLETLTIEHHKSAKAAHGRARKAAGELKKPIANIAKIIPKRPKTGLFAKAETTWLITPKAGKIKI